MNRIEIEVTCPYWSLVYNVSDKTVDDGYSMNLGDLKRYLRPIVQISLLRVST